jgi:hypothetical protein
MKTTENIKKDYCDHLPHFILHQSMAWALLQTPYYLDELSLIAKMKPFWLMNLRFNLCDIGFWFSEGEKEAIFPA